jgi:ParB/RepB/Spo0J family partition protein
MREFRQLPIDAIHESPVNPRRAFSETRLEELASSIRRHGVLQPILVRPNGDGFVLIAGARRLRAAKLAERPTILARVLDVDESAADEARIVENLQREDISPLEEGESYQRLLASGRTIDDLVAQLGKSKAYLYQRVSLTRLIPQAQDLLIRDILPLSYALKLATVPVERQADGLERCFRPLFRGQDASREQVEPLAELTAWIEKSVRLDPKSEDTSVLLPSLTEQVASAEQEREASVLALSTLHFHTDRTDPKPILAKSWKPAEGKARCAHARPGVIVLGEGQGTFVHACIEKKKCQKHWGRPKAAAATPSSSEQEADAARQRQEAQWAKRQAETERWRNELRPCAVRLIGARTAKITWSPGLLRVLLDHLGTDDLVREIVGKPDRLPVRRYPHAILVALAARHSYQREDFMRFTKRVGVRLTPKALEAASVEASAAATAADS